MQLTDGVHFLKDAICLLFEITLTISSPTIWQKPLVSVCESINWTRQDEVWDVMPIVVATQCWSVVLETRKVHYLLSTCTSCFCRQGIHNPKIFRLQEAPRELLRVVLLPWLFCSPPGVFSPSPQAHSIAFIKHKLHYPHLRVGYFSFLFQILKIYG